MYSLPRKLEIAIIKINTQFIYKLHTVEVKQRKWHRYWFILLQGRKYLSLSRYMKDVVCYLFHYI